MRTEPIDSGGAQTAPRITVAATYQDPVSKALYVHQDLVRVQGLGAVEATSPDGARARVRTAAEWRGLEAMR